VTPFGDIVAIPQRGELMGNRGSIHRGDRPEIARPWQVRRWITCELHYKGWVAPKWAPGRWTPLFFLDEAVALAAGHRPCALCRRADYERYRDAWEAATGDRPGADGLDEALHAERVDGRAKRVHRLAWSEVPVGAYSTLDGAPEGSAAALVLADRLLPWPDHGCDYGLPVARPARGTATLLTPPSSVAVLRHGYVPRLHASARPGP
jgi:hypothetical protein